MEDVDTCMKGCNGQCMNGWCSCLRVQPEEIADNGEDRREVLGLDRERA